MAVSQQDFDSAFPTGVALFLDSSRPVIDLVDLEVREYEGTTYVQGWTYPNKDILLVLDGYRETDQGWKVKTADGAPAFISPLPADREKAMSGLLSEG